MRHWKHLGSLAGALVLLSLGADQPTTTTCKLAIELVDADSGQVLPGLVQLEDAAGKPLVLEGLLSRGKGLAAEAPISRWSALAGSAAVVVPAAKLTVLALHGLEWEAARAEVDLTGKTASEVRVPLKRFHDPSKGGYRSANTHLHLTTLPRDEAERYLREIPRADGLDIVFLSYLERAGEDINYVSNQFTKEDLAALSRSSGVLFGNGEEHRHNFGAQDEGYGHVMLLDILKLIQPVSIGPGISKRGTDGLPLQRGIDAARADGATTIWCHNNWGREAIPSWLTGKLHAQNIFDG